MQPSKQQPRYGASLGAHEQIKDMWHENTQWNITQPQKERKWVDLEVTVLHEIRQTQKENTVCVLLTMWTVEEIARK